MATYVGKSCNFDDVDIIVNDLLVNCRFNKTAGKPAFLVADSQINSPALVKALAQKTGFTVVGGTSFTYPMSENVNEVSAQLTVLDMDTLDYALGVSQPLKGPEMGAQIREVFEHCRATLKGEPKMWMLYLPFIPGFNIDAAVNAVFALAGETPVFGGVTTDDLDSTKAFVFAGDQAYTDRMVLLALGGDIKPVFAVGSQLTVMTEYGPAVTESCGNVVSRVDDMSFCDYMRSLGISPEDRVNGVDALVQYGPLPCRLRHKLVDDDGVPEIRCISCTNVNEGSAVFSSAMPVGTRVNMGVIQKNDVTESSSYCVNLLSKRMRREEELGYAYSVIFSVPCVARYFATLGDAKFKKSLLAQIPDNLPFSMYYGFCEVGPTFSENGRLHNRSHNASVVMCAI